MNPKRIAALLMFATLLLSCLPLGSVRAAPLTPRPAAEPDCSTAIVVDSIADSGPGTLREALATTCAGAASTITFAEELSGGKIWLQSELVIGSDRTVVIDGSTLSPPIRISGDSDRDGTGDLRVLNIGEDVNATLDTVEITHGYAENGGGIYVSAGSELTVNRSTISQNTAALSGGGIYLVNSAKSLTINETTLEANTAEAGGAISSSEGSFFPELSITTSKLLNNRAGDVLAAVAWFGAVTMTNSTISGNSAPALYGPSTMAVIGGPLTAVGNTFSNNIGEAEGGHQGPLLYMQMGADGALINNTFTGNKGGMFGAVSVMILDSSLITVINNTFRGNSAEYDPEAEDDEQAVDLVVDASHVNFYNNILADPAVTTIPQCSISSNLGPLTLNAGNNLIETTSPTCPTEYSADPALEDLADNGGLTQTHALASDSVAIDAGSADQCPDTDQRGLSRPADGDRDGTADCDLGSYEAKFGPTDISISTDSLPENAPANTPVGTLATTSPIPESTFVYTLVSGAGATDNASFHIAGNQLRSAASFNYESKSSYSVRIRSTDDVGEWFEKSFEISVTDVNEAPYLSLVNTILSLPEDTNTASPLKVAEIIVIDDALGAYTLSLSGADADMFEISGLDLRLKAGAVLDFETNPVLNITAAVDDNTVGSTPDDTEALAIQITDVDDGQDRRIFLPLIKR